MSRKSHSLSSSRAGSSHTPYIQPVDRGTLDLITIASVPTAHPYIAHLRPVHSSPGLHAVSRLPDPVPAGAQTNDPWWPPRWLDPLWLADHLDRFDLMHLHFGFDGLPTPQLEHVVQVLRGGGKPLVFTVHDLHNPHFADNTLHSAHLGVLVTAADEVVTLTRGAAAEIRDRWNVEATVVPHPHVVPLDLVGHPRSPTSVFVVGIHAKNLRANLDPLAVMDTVVSATSEFPDAMVRLDIDDGVFAPDDRRGAASVGAALRRFEHRDVDVRVHPRFDDEQLWQYLTDIDVSVLPYRFGTHSGWLEACHDLGTAVVAPDCGYFSDQKRCHTFEFGIDRFEPATLRRALHDAHAARSTPSQAVRATREAERAEIAQRYDAVYARAIARHTTRVGAAS